MCCKPGPLPVGLGEGGAFELKHSVACAAADILQPNLAATFQALDEAMLLTDLLQGALDEVINMPNLVVILRSAGPALVEAAAGQVAGVLRSACLLVHRRTQSRAQSPRGS